MTIGPSLFVLGSFVVACSARVGHFPQRGESAIAEHFVVEAGGKGFNLAAGAHRLGANVHSVFAIGDDVFAKMAEPAFAQAGFTPTRLRRSPCKTGSGIGFIDATGETCVAIYPGANLTLAAEDIQAVAAHIAGAGAVLAQFEIADEPIATAFAIARQSGRETILNPSPFRMPPAEILHNTTILVVNDVEAASLTTALGRAFDGRGRRGMADLVLSMGPHTLIVTQGPHGAIAYRRAAPSTFQPAFSIQAVDSLGAGDAFLAGFSVGLVDGLPFEACLRQGAAAGALATLQPGVFDALATRDELEGFMSGRNDEARSINGDY